LDKAAAARRQAAISLLPPAPTFPQVTYNEGDDPTAVDPNSSGDLKTRRAQAAVYATAQEGTVAGFPVQPPNF
jgi:hypothetical protein